MSKRHSPTYAELVEAIGEADALALSKARGGRGLYIPPLGRLTPHSPAVQVLGPAAAEECARRWPGCTVDIPMTQGKRARVWELREGGKAIATIAGEMNCHERTVYNILAGPRPKALGEAAKAELPPLLAFIARR